MSQIEAYSRNKLVDYLDLKPLDIEICDVTLRDGEQTPGVVFTREEKIALATELDAVGVEIIESGFPVVSSDEKAIVKEIASMGLNAKTCCLSRSVISDVETAVDCDVDFISIFIAMSELHLKYKYHKTYEEMFSSAMEAVQYAKDHGVGVRFAAEDGSRTDINVLKKAFMAAEEYRVDYVSIADTIGILSPATTHYLVSEIKKVVRTPICIHCHNDLGMATANTLAAAEAGAKQLHTTVNAIGERAGNASLEEVLVSLRVQYGIERYDTTRLMKLSGMVNEFSGIRPAITKAIVGQHAFSHESGIHVCAILEEPRTYELFSPEMVGGTRHLIVGKHTGMKALRGITKSMGYNLEKDQLCALLERIKNCTEAKKGISPRRLKEMINEICAA
ncbi:homocitrate synthase family protein [Methanolobus chelungpuianus]|uniref:Trans-homoaconitate synthase n=1 Tax=Methanolobus chelungpuianus TaxID=502115 RepID=A0AAE3HBL0_9EURY|nr:homocitrate synthase family protein [Methanolobus chelungpuianus]MCQ6963129.1 trans-homoaconitate synthase [Methanolobus chelungpuianus]